MNNECDELFKEILDSNLEELLHHDLYTTNLAEVDRLYLKVLINYLKADHQELEICFKKVKEYSSNNEEDEYLKGLYYCSYIRLMIRKDGLTEDSLVKIQEISTVEPWSFELHFVLGMAFMRVGLFEKSAEHFHQSYTGFSKISCKRKALIAYQNHVVANINLYPNRSYLAEWSFLVKLARKEKISSMEGGALINLSREYQNIGSFGPALKVIDEALESLEQSMGTYQYYQALFQKCDILIALGRNAEALEVFQLAKLCPFLELKSSLEIIEKKMNPDKTLSGIEAPESVPWKERLAEIKSGKKQKAQGSLVQSLIHELEQEPMDKYTLIEKLYPENIDFGVKENRFNVLLSKVRKMYPGLIVKEGSLYKLEMTNKWLQKKIS